MSLSKLLCFEEAASESKRVRAAGGVVVLTNGCFDLLHAGHVRYLQAAKQRGDVLFVALNGDSSVRVLKGPSRPVNPERDRAEVLSALGCVDFATIFYTPRVTDVIRAVRPQIYVKGGDYTAESLDSGERQALEEVSAKVEILELVPGKSTTAMLQKMSVS